MDARMCEVVDPIPDDLVGGWGTKVTCTIGPPCQSVKVLSELLVAGMAAARIDLTWGSMDFHRASLRNLAEAMRATRRLCAVIVDTTGREIIVRREATLDAAGWPHVDKRPIEFKEGSEVTLTTRPDAVLSPTCLPLSVPAFPALVRPGQTLQVGRYLSTGADGNSLMLEVLSATADSVRCAALGDASLAGVLCVLVCHRQFDLASHGSDLNAELPLMTEHDVACLRAFAGEFEVDFVSLSYCNAAADVRAARATLEALGLGQTKVVAKVERKAAVHNFDEIVAEADAVVLSRGNLGLDFEPEEMALLQKACIASCNVVGRPIHLTRFVDTMAHTPRPTRAEATDVANAVLDGGDGVMLGAETLRGIYPVETVRTVTRLCRAAESYFDYRAHHEHMMGEAYDEEVALDRAAASHADLRALAARGAEGPRLGAPARAGSPGSLAPLATATKRLQLGGGAPASAPLGAARRAGEAERDGAGSPGSASAASGGRTPPAGGLPKPSSFGVLPALAPGAAADRLGRLAPGDVAGAPREGGMSKVESIASTAVRTAEKIAAGLIVVLAQTGRTVSLVAKYRPPMPVLAVVVPTLRSAPGRGWQLDGKYLARQCLVMRGVTPMLAAPMSESGEGLLGEAVKAAHALGLVKPHAHVVCILSQNGSLCVKVVQASADGSGIRQRVTRFGVLVEGTAADAAAAEAGAGNGASNGSHGGPLVHTASESMER
jgi:pyruvate kinase